MLNDSVSLNHSGSVSIVMLNKITRSNMISQLCRQINVLMVVLCLCVTVTAYAKNNDDAQDLLDMVDQLDRQDANDFTEAIAKANACTQTRNFDCTNTQLKLATKFANSSKDQQLLAAANQNMVNEKARIAEEARLRAEEDRRLAEAEERLRIAQIEAEKEAARRARAAEEQEDSNSTLLGLTTIAQMTVENYRSHTATAAVESASKRQAFNDMQNEVKAGLAAQQRRFEEQRAQIEADRRQREQQNSARLAASNERTRNAPTPVQYQSQKVTIPRADKVCPPGSTWYNPETGIGAPGGTCYLNPQVKGQSSQQTSANPRAASNTTYAGNTNGGYGSTGNDTSQPSAPKQKKVEWGPIQLEALAICYQSPKSGKWACNGSLDNQIIVDEPSLESALSRQHCDGGTWAAGGPVLNGKQWDVYRCGRALGAGDYDIAKQYNLITARRSYICPKYQLGDGRCSTIYDGQDKR